MTRLAVRNTPYRQARFSFRSDDEITQKLRHFTPSPAAVVIPNDLCNRSAIHLPHIG